MSQDSRPQLSIAIPAYNRPEQLLYSLKRFVKQIEGKYEEQIEIIITDDLSPDDALRPVAAFCEQYDYIDFRVNPVNIGLERNLIASTEGTRGEYLWVFGDDDFLDPPDALDEIMAHLEREEYDFYILNRVRRSTDLSRLISPNWMGVDPDRNYPFDGLREFCVEHGFISIIGFITVNIFRRAPFQAVDASRYYGSMYPQLGAMVEAFHDRPTLLLGRPLICHRTQSQREKRAALGRKALEADFMSDRRIRDATYFSHPFTAMLLHLVGIGAFSPQDIVVIPENTVINGYLVDFLIQTVEQNAKLLPGKATQQQWIDTMTFFNMLPLTRQQRAAVGAIPVEEVAPGVTRDRGAEGGKQWTISVITPSYNQAEYLGACLESVQKQTYQPIEHLVFDPGSTDGSREIAESFSHVTLIAEEDEGQSDAINKGFQLAQGDIIAWVNSDDFYADPDVFRRVVARFQQPDRPDIVYGKGYYIDENGEWLRDAYINKKPSTFLWRFHQEDGVMQPAVFMTREAVERVGLLRPDLHFTMDYEYWIRCVKAGLNFAYIDDTLAVARYHLSNKTYGMRDKSYKEICAMVKEHFGYVNHIWLRRYAEFLVEGYDGVLAHGAKDGLTDVDRVDQVYRQLMIAYNTDQDTYQTLRDHAQEKGYRETLDEMQALSATPPVPARQIKTKWAAPPNHVAYTVGQRHWAFDKDWKAQQIEKAHEFFRRQIFNRENDVCIIVGNGPSLNKIDLSLLEGQDVIISNNAFLSEELLRHATFYTVVNYLVAEQSSHEINQLTGVHKVLPYWLAYCLNPGPDTYFVDAIGHDEFSTNIFNNMSWRHTVSFFNMHLAYGLGYRKVLLIGFDHSYTQPTEVKEQDIIQSDEPDVNHFISSYFRGKKWQAADVDNMEHVYRLAKVAFEADGREIVNCTAGGHLELFRRSTLEEELAPTHTTTGPRDLYPRVLLVSSHEPNAGLAEVLSRYPERSVLRLGISDHEPVLSSSDSHLDLQGMVGAGSEGAAKVVEAFSPDVIYYQPSDDAQLHALATIAIQRSNVPYLVESGSAAKYVSGLQELTAGAYQQIETEQSLAECENLLQEAAAARGWRPGARPLSVADGGLVGQFEREQHAGLNEVKLVASYMRPADGTPILLDVGAHHGSSLAHFKDRSWRIVAFEPDGGNRSILQARTVGSANVTIDPRAVSDQPQRGVPFYRSDESSGISSLLAFTDRHEEAAQVDTTTIAEVCQEYGLDRIDLLKIDVEGYEMNVLRGVDWNNGPTPDVVIAEFEDAKTSQLGYTVHDLAQFLQARGYHVYASEWHPIVQYGIQHDWRRFVPYPAHFPRGAWGNLIAFQQEPDVAHLTALVQQHVSSVTQPTRRRTRIRGQVKHRLLSLARKVRSRLGRVYRYFRGGSILPAILAALLLAVSFINFPFSWVFALLALAVVLSMLANSIMGVHATLNQVTAKMSELEASHLSAQEVRRIAEQGLSDVERQVQEINRDMSQLTGRAHSISNRVLDNHAVARLHGAWNSVLGLDGITRNQLHYYAHRIRTLESNSIGRLATSIESAVLRCLVTLSAGGDRVSVLEIGSLFGIGAAAIHEVCRTAGVECELHLIDPLHGYYGEQVRDVVLNVKVDAETLWLNLSRADVPVENVHLYQGLSNDAEIVSRIQQHRLDVVVIDGDHSYDGVKADFENYLPSVREGGYIIFDDYGHREWPDIQTFVDNEVRSVPDVEFVGADWHMAVFRKL